MKTLKAKLFTLSFFAGSMVFAQTTDFNDYETNQEGAIDRTGFEKGYGENFDQWDTNRDGTVDDREFYETTFRYWDANEDGKLDQDEWTRGQNNVYGDYRDYRVDTESALNEDMSRIRQSLGRFDTNRDNNISSEEYRTGFHNSNFFNSYDTNRDGSLDRNELNQGVFNNMDANRDGTIDRNEYDAYGSYYGESSASN